MLRINVTRVLALAVAGAWTAVLCTLPVWPAQACSLQPSFGLRYPSAGAPIASNHHPLIVSYGVEDVRIVITGAAYDVEVLPRPDGSDLLPVVRRLRSAGRVVAGSYPFSIAAGPAETIASATGNLVVVQAAADASPPAFTGPTRLVVRDQTDMCSGGGLPGSLFAQLMWERPAEPILVHTFQTDPRGSARLPRGVVADLPPEQVYPSSMVLHIPPGAASTSVCFVADAEDMAGNRTAGRTICCLPASGAGEGSCWPIEAPGDAGPDAQGPAPGSDAGAGDGPGTPASGGAGCACQLGGGGGGGGPLLPVLMTIGFLLRQRYSPARRNRPAACPVAARSSRLKWD